MNVIKSIETCYGGHRFRSRLEARWAVFFDACGVDWEYEPEGFVLRSGLKYLPDFLLKDVVMLYYDADNNSYGFGERDLWCEVRGIDAQRLDSACRVVCKLYEMETERAPMSWLEKIIAKRAKI